MITESDYNYHVGQARLDYPIKPRQCSVCLQDDAPFCEGIPLIGVETKPRVQFIWEQTNPELELSVLCQVTIFRFASWEFWFPITSTYAEFLQLLAHAQ